jgi:hypothetical protein
MVWILYILQSVQRTYNMYWEEMLMLLFCSPSVNMLRIKETNFLHSL